MAVRAIVDLMAILLLVTFTTFLFNLLATIAEYLCVAPHTGFEYHLKELNNSISAEAAES